MPTSKKALALVPVNHADFQVSSCRAFLAEANAVFCEFDGGFAEHPASVARI